MRAKKTLHNVISGYMYQIVSIACSIILPRIILSTFGSQYNGITQAVTQFLSVVVLLQAGVSAVTMAALYSPLAKNDNKAISSIMKATEKYYRQVSLIFLGIILVVSVIYPFAVIEEFDWFFTFSLVLIMVIGTFAQYFFGMTYKILLFADHRRVFADVVDTVKVVLNTLVACILLLNGNGIHVVKLISSLVYAISPIVIAFYVKRKYSLDKNAKPDFTAIKQRWDNFGQQIATFVCNNTDIVVLSLFTNLYEVSVYVVYDLVFKGLFNLFLPLVNSSLGAFGNMFAKGETKQVTTSLALFEDIVCIITTIFYGVTSVMIVSFVQIYTLGVTDVNYTRPLFAILAVLSGMFRCFRIPQQQIVMAVGHFRQTRNGAYMEALINISLSLILVHAFGLVGVIIGTLAAYVFRTVQYGLYVSNRVVFRKPVVFIRKILNSLVNVTIIYFLGKLFLLDKAVNIQSWLTNAALLTIIAVGIAVMSELIFYRNNVRNALQLVSNLKKK